jgi:hypothetical protein
VVRCIEPVNLPVMLIGKDARYLSRVAMIERQAGDSDVTGRTAPAEQASLIKQSCKLPEGRGLRQLPQFRRGNGFEKAHKVRHAKSPMKQINRRVRRDRGDNEVVR